MKGEKDLLERMAQNVEMDYGINRVARIWAEEIRARAGAAKNISVRK